MGEKEILCYPLPVDSLDKEFTHIVTAAKPYRSVSIPRTNDVGEPKMMLTKVSHFNSRPSSNMLEDVPSTSR